jgi:hypothetical protein
LATGGLACRDLGGQQALGAQQAAFWGGGSLALVALLHHVVVCEGCLQLCGSCCSGGSSLLGPQLQVQKRVK